MIRLAVRVHREQAELVLAELLELAPAGVEEVALDANTIEYAVYGSPGELPALPDLNAAVGDALVELSTSELPDDWSERWKSFHRPVLIAAPKVRDGVPAHLRQVPCLRVRPPWEPAGEWVEGDVQEIVIDPGQAFGTGGHASTRLCLELLLELAAQQPDPCALLDVGTGSGVLAIAAARLGFDPVLGLDHERESVHAARENATANAVEIAVRRFDLRAEPLPWAGATERPPRPVVIVANLLRPLLLELADTMSGGLTANLIAGGLLCGEVDEVVGAFAKRLGLLERTRRVSGEWAAVWLTAAA